MIINNNNSIKIRFFVINFNHFKSFSSISTKQQKDKISVIPHPISKLRLFNYVAAENENIYERRLREHRIQIQNFNHEYWSKINQEFNQKKAKYIEMELKRKNIIKDNDNDFSDSTRTHEELAQFYKKFLDDNHQRYIEYNKQWYRNNLILLWHSLIVSIINLLQRFKLKNF